MLGDNYHSSGVVSRVASEARNTCGCSRVGVQPSDTGGTKIARNDVYEGERGPKMIYDVPNIKACQGGPIVNDKGQVVGVVQDE